MAKSFLVAGLAGSVVLGSWAARAQESPAQQPQASDQQAQATPPAPAVVPFCSSVLGCLLSGGARPAQSEPAPSPAPQPVAADAAPQTAPAAQLVDDEPAPRAKAKPKAKPVHPVTIAAGASEVGRLKGLVATMPRGKVRIVKSVGDKGADVDFSVTTTLDQHKAGERARLFTEQMHIVAGGPIQSLADLENKVVSFGPDKSASQAAARKAFEALNIPVKETPLDLDNALDGLATGDIAAVVVLAPQPVQRFEKLSAPGLHLVSWPQDGALPAGAVASTIDATRYPGLAKPDETIRAVGVDAVLEISAKGERQPACKTFLAALAQHSAALSKHGFGLLKADLQRRSGRRFAADERR